ncbi:DinB superfamily protein [Posidoniimonas corsicana]|uniref:DinB superfamily protein n=1 Tax=Posidoniimonas corsicana TaxID=1938618 RepID=A0A5C5VHU0_9BACT|nr:DinB superfamily protein [Posidoniimonas corsicana]
MCLRFIRGVAAARWLIIASALIAATPAHADPGDPLAVRRWLGGAITIETHWGLNLVVDPGTESRVKPPLRTGQQQVVSTRVYDHVLERTPNSAEAEWRRAPVGADAARPNAVRVRTLQQDANGAAVLAITVDEAVVIVAPQSLQRIDLSVIAEKQPPVDLLVLGVPSNAGNELKRLVDAFKPRVVLLNPADSLTEEELEQVRKELSTKQIERRAHNTIAVSSGGPSPASTRVVLIGESPWTPPAELKELITAMQEACDESQAVFAGLTAEQLNFQPPNGTHTPRWNAEHMMGRQLQFFSQIYHALSPEIPVLDLNPRQMPTDYQPAHPDWDGQEEARQMQRVMDFTLRFAYLLDGVDLDRPAPGSRWTLRRLLKQMQRHYDEHTANTVSKFNQPGWPGGPAASR